MFNNIIKNPLHGNKYKKIMHNRTIWKLLPMKKKKKVKKLREIEGMPSLRVGDWIFDLSDSKTWTYIILVRI